MTNVTHIPTYEIVTSCQPAVVYSTNGYYYTSFVQDNCSHASGAHAHSGHTPTVNVVTVAPGSCMACACHQWAASNSAALQQPQQS